MIKIAAVFQNPSIEACSFSVENKSRQWEQGGLFRCSFGKLLAPYLRKFMSVFFQVCQKKVKKKKEGKGYMEVFFFPTGFERKYLTKGSFVCFQMIDFGIWATPLAVQG